MGKGFDPSGDSPEFRRDQSKSQLPPAAARAYAIKMEQLRRNRKKGPPKGPSDEKRQRGIERQQHMNEHQFKEPEDRGPNPNWTPPAPGTYGGPPLPREPKE